MNETTPLNGSLLKYGMAAIAFFLICLLGYFLQMHFTFIQDHTTKLNTSITEQTRVMQNLTNKIDIYLNGHVSSLKGE